MARTILRFTCWTVFGLVAFVIACNVVNRCGETTGAVLALVTAGAAFAPTEKAIALIARFRRALVRAGVSEKEFAIDCDLTKGQLSNAFALREQLSFPRMANTRDEVWIEFARDLLQDSGRYVVIEKGALADLVVSNQGLIAALDAKALPHDRARWADAERIAS